MRHCSSSRSESLGASVVNARVVRRVGLGLRQGSGEVVLFVRDRHFDKAYLLNRFVVHLIEACSHAQQGAPRVASAATDRLRGGGGIRDLIRGGVASVAIATYK